jgi:hypothetical protein
MGRGGSNPPSDTPSTCEDALGPRTRLLARRTRIAPGLPRPPKPGGSPGGATAGDSRLERPRSSSRRPSSWATSTYAPTATSSPPPRFCTASSPRTSPPVRSTATTQTIRSSSPFSPASNDLHKPFTLRRQVGPSRSIPTSTAAASDPPRSRSAARRRRRSLGRPAEICSLTASATGNSLEGSSRQACCL